MAADEELELVEVDEVGQLSLGVPGEQRALDGLAAPVSAPDVVDVAERMQLGRRRARLEARAEKREEWAAARQRDGDAARTRVHEIADRIPFGQPILVGHHSERGARADQRRIENGMRSAVENWNMADRHESKAEGLGRALRTSVYSDDVDAVEQLEQKIRRLEEKRDRWKKYNRARRGRDVAAHEHLDEQQRREVDNLARFSHLRDNGQTPGYVLTNLTANIRRLQKRLAEIKRDRATVAAGDRGRGRPMLARFASSCAVCGGEIEKGSPIVYYRLVREAVHEACAGV